jgi:hypothetical protein
VTVRGYVFAKAFGDRVAWCNRQDAPAEELGLSADVVVAGLAELPREGARKRAARRPRAARDDGTASVYLLPSLFRFT